MSRLLKKTICALILIMSIGFNMEAVKAASASISLSTSSKSISINNTVTVTVTVSESGGKLGSWNYEISHDSSKLTLISGSEGQYGEVGDGNITSKSYTLKYKAIAPGTATINVNNADIRDWDSEESLNVNKGSVTINIINPSSNSSSNSGSSSSSVTKSSDNNLKSLNIEGVNLNPEFNKDTLEYNIELASDTTKIKVNAEVNDSKAKVSGIGEIEVKEGTNKIEVVVTAENGSTKTYIINAYVKEKDPIKVKVSGKEYTVLRSLEELTIPQSFEEIDVTIDNEVVKGCYNSNIDYTLVALKDSEGKISFFIYDLKKSTYSKYNMITSSNLSIVITKLENENEIPYKYFKSKFIYNEEEVEGYALNENSDFRVVYGINAETGEEGFYLYDMKENTIQRFYNDQVNIYVELIRRCKLAFIALGTFIILLTIIIIILLSKNVKFKKKYLNARLNPIDNPKYNEVKYQDLEGTTVIDKVDTNKKKNKKNKTFLDE